MQMWWNETQSLLSEHLFEMKRECWLQAFKQCNSNSKEAHKKYISSIIIRYLNMI